MLLLLVFASQGPRSINDSPTHVLSPEQYTEAERKHEQDIITAKQEKAQARDEEALRVSIEQLREVCIFHFLSLAEMRKCYPWRGG